MNPDPQTVTGFADVVDVTAMMHAAWQLGAIALVAALTLAGGFYIAKGFYHALMSFGDGTPSLNAYEKKIEGMNDQQLARAMGKTRRNIGMRVKVYDRQRDGQSERRTKI